MALALSEKWLKDKALEFSLDNIVTLNLQKQNIYGLGCLDKCTHLVVLDLSCNHISSLSALKSMSLLVVLLAPNNRISSLAGCEGLESLHTLDIAGNLINNADALLPLVNLKKLQVLRLSDLWKELSNPLFHSNLNARKEVIRLLPNLQRLDGDLAKESSHDAFAWCDQFFKQMHSFHHEKSEVMSMLSDIQEQSWPDLVSSCSISFTDTCILKDTSEAASQCQILHNMALELIQNSECKLV